MCIVFAYRNNLFTIRSWNQNAKYTSHFDVILITFSCCSFGLNGFLLQTLSRKWNDQLLIRLLHQLKRSLIKFFGLIRQHGYLLHCHFDRVLIPILIEVRPRSFRELWKQETLVCAHIVYILCARFIS